MVVTVRPTSLTGAGAIDYRSVSTLALYDHEDQIVGAPLSDAYLRGYVSQCCPSPLQQSQEVYILPFSLDIAGSHGGSQLGYFALSGQEQLEIIMPTGFVTASMNVTVNAYMYSHMKVQNVGVSISN